METRTVRISLSPKSIEYLVLVIGVSLILFWLITRDDTSKNVQEKQKEFVVPLDFGVADPGFEGKITNFTTLNAKASVDTHDKIDDLSSLKISFSDQSVASVKIPGYFNTINEEDFYRLGFWAKTDASTDKEIAVRIAEKENIQDLGRFSISRNEDVTYFEFNFQAINDAQDLIFTSADGVASGVWIDNMSVEKINVSSSEELQDIRSTIFGNTTWKNIDQSQGNDSGDSGDFLSRPARKMGQTFRPSREMLSGVAFKIIRHGTGGTGTYQVQLREFDEELGVLSDIVIASAFVNQTPKSKVLDEIIKKEQQMREDFQRNEKEIKDAFLDNEQDIKAGKTENTEIANRYPDTFTQDQIDAANAARRTAQADAQVGKRAAELEMSIRDMKESFNTVEKIDIPLAAKLDLEKKYWIGIDNSSAVVDQNNYISVVTVEEGTGGFASEVAGIWMNSSALWFETFYPEHRRVNDDKILSGATISDIGEGKLMYRYHFAPDDSSSLSGFSGRKVYDLIESSYDTSDANGNFGLAYDDFAVYRFNTVYPANKIIVREANFHQSLLLEVSTDGENWEEIYSNNPAADGQSIDPIVFNPKEKTTAFYLRIKAGGNSSILYGLSVEAELEK